MSFTKFTRKYIFEPLEMGSTQYTRPSDGTAAELYETTKKSGYEYETHPGAYCFPDWPSGQLWTTAEDLAKFSKAMLKRGRLESKTKDGADCLYSEVTGMYKLFYVEEFVGKRESPSTHFHHFH